MANNSGSNIDIEVYEPTHCFRCHAPIYIKPDDYGVPFGEQVTLIAFDFGTGRCHYCVQEVQTRPRPTQTQPKELEHEVIS